MSPRKLNEQKYKNARSNLLLVVIFTCINIALLVTNTDTYFLFSAFVPYYIAGLGMYLCGRFPEEYYTQEELMEGFLDDRAFTIFIVIAVIFTLLYLLSWWLSHKNRGGFLIITLVFFAFDTILMFCLNGFNLSSIIDILFHGWVIFSLISGIVAHFRLKKLPEETECESEEVFEDAQPSEACETSHNSDVLRIADKEAKHKVLLQACAFSYDICYRRVGRTNELVINGNVYDEYTALMEMPHLLHAFVDGHLIEAGCNNQSQSFIRVDGEIVAKKLRLL